MSETVYFDFEGFPSKKMVLSVIPQRGDYVQLQHCGRVLGGEVTKVRHFLWDGMPAEIRLSVTPDP